MSGDYFTNYGDAAVSARVAVQLVKRAYRSMEDKSMQGQHYAYVALAQLDGIGVPMVRMALHSLAVWLEQQRPSKDWLAGVCYRDLMGYTFRRCFFAEYKAKRRLTPPISNTGGQLSLFAAGLDNEEEVPNASQSGTTHNEGDSRHRLAERDATRRKLRLSDLAR